MTVAIPLPKTANMMAFTDHTWHSEPKAPVPCAKIWLGKQTL
jgi:hypothetical protein